MYDDVIVLDMPLHLTIYDGNVCLPPRDTQCLLKVDLKERKSLMFSDFKPSFIYAMHNLLSLFWLKKGYGYSPKQQWF